MAKAAADLGGPWIYSVKSGEIKHVNWLQWSVFYSTGVAGPWIPFDTKEQAEAYKAKHPVKKTPISGAVGGALDPVTSGKEALENLKKVGGTLTDISGLATALTQRNTWLRIGEGALGVLLIGIGVMALTRNTPVGQAVKTGVGVASNVVPAGKIAKIAKGGK